MKLAPLAESDTELNSRIEAIEHQIDCTLPDDYVAFLRGMNGAVPVEPVSIPLVDNKYTNVHIIYGSSSELSSVQSLEYWLDNRPNSKSLLVANDSGANPFWISLAEEDFGVVYFEEYDWPESSGPVADSWTNFLKL